MEAPVESAINPNSIRLKRLLGRGAHASVHHATGPSKGQQWAVKLHLPGERACKDTTAERNFLEEAEVMQELRCANVVRCYGLLDLSPTACRGNISGLPGNGRVHAMLLEYMEAGSMARLVLNQMSNPGTRCYTDYEALQLLLDVALGLRCLHSQPVTIVHRDLKLENLLLTRKHGRLQAKIADLGLHAKLHRHSVPALLRRKLTSSGDGTTVTQPAIFASADPSLLASAQDTCSSLPPVAEVHAAAQQLQQHNTHAASQQLQQHSTHTSGLRATRGQVVQQHTAQAGLSTREQHQLVTNQQHGEQLRGEHKFSMATQQRGKQLLQQQPLPLQQQQEQQEEKLPQTNMHMQQQQQQQWEHLEVLPPQGRPQLQSHECHSMCSDLQAVVQEGPASLRLWSAEACRAAHISVASPTDTPDASIACTTAAAVASQALESAAMSARADVATFAASVASLEPLTTTNIGTTTKTTAAAAAAAAARTATAASAVGTARARSTLVDLAAAGMQAMTHQPSERLGVHSQPHLDISAAPATQCICSDHPMRSLSMVQPSRQSCKDRQNACTKLEFATLPSMPTPTTSPAEDTAAAEWPAETTLHSVTLKDGSDTTPMVLRASEPAPPQMIAAAPSPLPRPSPMHLCSHTRPSLDAQPQHSMPLSSCTAEEEPWQSAQQHPSNSLQSQPSCSHNESIAMQQHRMHYHNSSSPRPIPSLPRNPSSPFVLQTHSSSTPPTRHRHLLGLMISGAKPLQSFGWQLCPPSAALSPQPAAPALRATHSDRHEDLVVGVISPVRPIHGFGMLRKVASHVSLLSTSFKAFSHTLHTHASSYTPQLCNAHTSTVKQQPKGRIGVIRSCGGEGDVMTTGGNRTGMSGCVIDNDEVPLLASKHHSTQALPTEGGCLTWAASSNEPANAAQPTSAVDASLTLDDSDLSFSWIVPPSVRLVSNHTAQRPASAAAQQTAQRPASSAAQQTVQRDVPRQRRASIVLIEDEEGDEAAPLPSVFACAPASSRRQAAPPAVHVNADNEPVSSSVLAAMEHNGESRQNRMEHNIGKGGQDGTKHSSGKSRQDGTKHNSSQSRQDGHYSLLPAVQPASPSHEDNTGDPGMVTDSQLVDKQPAAPTSPLQAGRRLLATLSTRLRVTWPRQRSQITAHAQDAAVVLGTATSSPAQASTTHTAQAPQSSNCQGAGVKKADSAAAMLTATPKRPSLLRRAMSLQTKYSPATIQPYSSEEHQHAVVMEHRHTTGYSRTRSLRAGNNKGEKETRSGSVVGAAIKSNGLSREFQRVYHLTTETGSCMYMAPEVYRGEPYNESVDVFSLGVVMYELLARSMLVFTHVGVGRTANTTEAYAEAVSKGFRPDRPDAMDAKVWTLISACWAQDPLDRPRIKHVVQELTRLMEAARQEVEDQKSQRCSSNCCVIS